MVAGSFLLIGLSGSLVSWASAPSSVLLVLRFAIAAAVLWLVFARRHPLRAIMRRDLWPKLLLMGVLDSAALLAYFFAVRSTGVAIATFFLFLQPVWVALLAPRLLKTPTEPIVYLSLGVALAGLGVILAPALMSDDVQLSAIGLAVGLAGGICYAFFQLLVKGLTKRLSSATIVVWECSLDTVFILPLALWQGVTLQSAIGGRDLIAALILGLVCTAIAYTMWVDGMARIPVQHSSILGFLTPVVAPLFAWALLGESVSVSTAVGGVLIVVAGLLVVAFGRDEQPAEIAA